MGDYPDPDEEYELMYSDDLELLRDMDDNTESNPVRKKLQTAKRSLDFSSPVAIKTVSSEISNANTASNNTETNALNSTDASFSLTPSLQPLDDILSSSNGSNKRTVDDLFGDINDIDFDNMEMPSKKQKTEEECDMELIDKIIEGRRQRQLLTEPSARGIVDTGPNYDVKENITTSVPKWPFIPLKNSNGDRIYVRLLCEDLWDDSLDKVTNQLSLQTTYASVWQEARKIIEAKKQQSESIEISQQAETNDNVANELWVEKYRPKSYIDLLSEEPVNRALLHWLHLWDKIVFKKDVKTKEPQQRNANKWKGKKENEPELDEDGRPHHKVALLCGPPGVGKTTLAHLLARLAGYRPVEINASDERSTEAFQTALQSATLMQSVLDAERRPNCLILDEIDGAPIQTVELLVKWCTTSIKKEEGKKKTKTQPLKRPVIAICNDLYATSLRPLSAVLIGRVFNAHFSVQRDGSAFSPSMFNCRRAAALVVFVGSATARLAARLARVCGAEHVRVPARALAALAARVRGDVRAALHALAFLRARGRGTVSPPRRTTVWRAGRRARRAARARLPQGARPGHGESAAPHYSMACGATCAPRCTRSPSSGRAAGARARGRGTVSPPRRTTVWRAGRRARRAARARLPQGARPGHGESAAPHYSMACGATCAPRCTRSPSSGRAAGINIEDVENAAIGTKDNTTSVMQALQAIFSVDDNETNSILKTIQAAGEYDRIIEGIFENYLTARVDSRLLIACETMSWLRLYDVINSWTQRTQNYSLYGLLPLCIARCHYLLASRQQTKVKFPMQAQEMSRRRAELESAVAAVRAARADVSRRALRLDLLPLLPYVLSPVLRSANVQLCSETERKSLQACAGAMCDFGLQYTQQRTPEGLYAFVLEPDVYKVAFFGSEERLRPSPAVRQTIAREQQLEMIRRNENMMNRMSSKDPTSEAKQKTDKQPNIKDTKTQLPNHLQRLQPKVIEKTAQVHKDFFGRIVPLSQVQKQDAVSDVISSSSVFYQYREGFNNAVRRNVRIRDLL
ncbi:chromosome transmission fidelity protein 18 homolog [Melitaea cinxia]|uniref:chromosome transmission fidelity protein 18 homolog n=1 Tax=Melitaea cinxia TaxID=113334 RepID=UPI001E271F88|nr:chromosome transmission fidelity protein 18 homolog [Melitaea cinxia]